MMGNEVSRLDGIKAVSFDVDGTLWDFESVMRRSLGEALQELRRIDPKAANSLDVDKMIDVRERVHHRLATDGVDLVTIRLEAFRETLGDVGRPDDMLASRLNDVYFKLRYAEHHLYDDVVPTLEALRGRFKLGVLSNGNSYPSRFGLDDMFAFTVFSQDHGGIEKPDPRLFEIAVAEAGCAPDELLHVGDHLEYDVLGAQNAGIRGVWLNRDGQPGGDGAAGPTLEVSSLYRLLDALSVADASLPAMSRLKRMSDQ